MLLYTLGGDIALDVGLCFVYPFIGMYNKITFIIFYGIFNFLVIIITHDIDTTHLA